MVMPLDAGALADVVAPGDVGGVVVALVDDELHELSRMSSAAVPAANGYLFMWERTIPPRERFTDTADAFRYIHSQPAGATQCATGPEVVCELAGMIEYASTAIDVQVHSAEGRPTTEPSAEMTDAT